MNNRPNLKSFALTAAVALCSINSAGLVLAGEHDEQKVAVSDLPASVVETAKKTIAGAEITGAEMEDKHGSTEYELDITSAGSKFELAINSDGKLLSQSQDIAIKDLPASIVAGIKKDMPDAEVTGAEKEIKDGKTSYEVDVKSAGKKWEAKLDADGSLQSKKIDDDND